MGVVLEDRGLRDAVRRMDLEGELQPIEVGGGIREDAAVARPRDEDDAEGAAAAEGLAAEEGGDDAVNDALAR